MRGVNRTHNGGQTYVQKTNPNSRAATGQVAKSFAKWSTSGRDVSRAAHVEVVDRGPEVGSNRPLVPSGFERPVLPLLDSQPAVSGVNASCATSDDAARGATASASSETKSAVRPSVEETLENIGVKVLFVKRSNTECNVKLSYKGSNVTLRQDAGNLKSVGVRGIEDIKTQLSDVLYKNKLTFLDLVTDLKPKDAPESGGIFSLLSSLWS